VTKSKWRPPGGNVAENWAPLNNKSAGKLNCRRYYVREGEGWVDGDWKAPGRVSGLSPQFPPTPTLLQRKGVNFLRLLYVRIDDIGSLATSLNPWVRVEPAKTAAKKSCERCHY